jgi:hypothetical protein
VDEHVLRRVVGQVAAHNAPSQGLHARGVREIKPFERVRVATDRARDIARVGVWPRHAMHAMRDGGTS